MRFSLFALASLVSATCVLALPRATVVKRAPQAPESSNSELPSSASIPTSAPTLSSAGAPGVGDSEWSALNSQLQSVNHDLSSWGGNAWNGSGWGWRPGGPGSYRGDRSDWSLSGTVTATLTSSGPSGLETSTVTHTFSRPSGSAGSWHGNGGAWSGWSSGKSWSHPSWKSDQWRSWVSGASSLDSQAKSLYSQASAQTSPALSSLANSFSAQADALSALAGAATSTASSGSGSTATSSSGGLSVQSVGMGAVMATALLAAVLVWA